MKLWVFCCLLAAATARPADSKFEPVELILNDIYNPGGDKGFSISYELGDNTAVQSKGKLVKVVSDDKEVPALVITGSYSFYIDGVKYEVKYTADENGYHPKIIQETEVPPGAYPPGVLDSLLGG